MKTRSAQSLDTAVLTDVRDFAGLREEWEDLYSDSTRATPFQSWAWLYSWWESYGEAYELRLVMVRDGGLLVGLVPLMLERRRGIGRLLFIGTGITDYLDVLARDGWEAEITAPVVRALKRMDRWQIADLQQLRPEAAAWSIFESWDGPRARVRQDGFPMIDVKPWNEVLGALSRNLRSTARRTIKRANKDGVRCELATPAEAEQAARRFVALHREMWGGRDIRLEHLTERFESFFVAAAERLTACGLGRISQFWLDEEVIASHFLLFGRDFVGEHLFGARQEILRRYQLSSLYLWDAVNVALSRDSDKVNLLQGEESYKLRWASEVIYNHRVTLLKNPNLNWLLVAYLSLVDLEQKARRYVFAESTSPWIKKTVRWLKGRRMSVL
jgi:CelD/BcsL family acetyltransferase involved in cellulose biosynthesis